MVVTASAPTVASSAEVVAVDDGTTGGTPATDEAMVPENEPFSSSTDATIGPAPSADDEEAVPPEAAVSSSTLDTDTTAASPVNGMVVPEADAATSSSSSSSSSSHTDTTIAPAPSALDEVVVPEVDIVSNSSNSRTDTIIAPAPSALDEVAVSEADAVSSSNRSGSTDAAMALAPSAVEMAVQEAETPSTTPNTSIAPAPSAVEGMAAPEADAVIDYAIGTPDSFSETALIERDGPVGNPCLTSSPCDVLVACTPSSTTGGYTCGVCPAGYAGDGSTCTDIDECSAADNGGCAVQAECTNIPGGRTCGGCPEGMLGSGDSRCLPSSDSCTDDNGGCDLLTVCTDTLDDGNSNGSALNCGECPAGYVGSGATGCIDEDACATSGGEACYGACVDVQAPGTGFKCASCPAGMVGDGTSCIANLCFDGNGGCDATVTCTMDFSTGTAACGECPCGYAPEQDPSLSSGWRCAEVDGCALEPCWNEGGFSQPCEDIRAIDGACAPSAGRVCGDCPAGFEVGEEGIGCRDVDECAEENGQCWVLASSPEGLRSTCINKLGGRECGACPEGYIGTGEAGCRERVLCNTNHGNCDPLSTCTDNFATGYADCGPCPMGYSGTGNTACVDTDGCTLEPCFHGVECTDVAAPGEGRTCGSCPEGYHGDGASCGMCTLLLSFEAQMSTVVEGAMKRSAINQLAGSFGGLSQAECVLTQ
eukprot:gene23697-biopygen24515